MKEYYAKTTHFSNRNLIFTPFSDIECGLPASIPHGSYKLVNGSVGYLSTVIYSCHEGYEMVGRAMLSCDIDERWNGPPPRCEGKCKLEYLHLKSPF